ncbi:MAG: DUF3486 family protein [Candidatus Competibacter denitrificans]
MAPPSKVALLPEDLRREFETRLVRGAFSGYEALSDWLTEQGYEISKSVLHKHGQRLKRKLEAIQTSTQAAQLLAEAAPDDAGLLSSAVLSLVQTEMFDLLVNLQEAQDEDDPGARVKLLGNAAHAMADLARASLKQKEWANGVRERASAAAEAVEKIAKRGGLNADTAAEIRREILGIAA